MTLGNNSEFGSAWRDLRETFARKLARKYLGLNIGEMAIRSYDVTKPLTAVLGEIKRRNIIETTMFRAGRRIRVVLRMNVWRHGSMKKPYQLRRKPKRPSVACGLGNLNRRGSGGKNEGTRYEIIYWDLCISLDLAQDSYQPVIGSGFCTTTAVTRCFLLIFGSFPGVWSHLSRRQRFSNAI